MHLLYFLEMHLLYFIEEIHIYIKNIETHVSETFHRDGFHPETFVSEHNICIFMYLKK